MRSWTVGLQKKELAKLNQKIDSLAMHGIDLIPGVVSPTGIAAIFKLKVQGPVKLRPILCEGPGRSDLAFTFLLGAKEVSWGYVPPKAPEIGAELRKDLINYPARRRFHERIN